MAIQKGRHYLVKCDGPGCKEALSYIVDRHDVNTKRNVKQLVVKMGWLHHVAGTVLCVKCRVPTPPVDAAKQYKELIDNTPKTEENDNDGNTEEGVS